MKRLLLVCAMIFCLMPLMSAAEQELPPLQSPFYQVRRADNPDTGDTWAVISRQGRVMAEGTAPACHNVPALVFAEGDLIGLREDGGNASWYTFYDVASERISRDYQNVIALRGETVLFTDYLEKSWRIVLADVFSGEVIRSRPIDMRTAEGRVTGAEWVEDSASWRITYPAGENDEETTVLFPAVPDAAGSLYPIRENGLWGYMNRAGETVIAPQWAKVWPFDGEWALVSTVPVSETADPPYGNGIIGRDGQYLVAPREDMTIVDYPHAWRIRCKNDQGLSCEGFFDKASGFCQPPVPAYAHVMLWDEDGSGPIAIENADGLTGYVDRTTGETVIPFIYTGDGDGVCFRDGFAMPADDLTVVDADGHTVAMGAESHLIDAGGKEVTLPDGMSAVSRVFDGCLIVTMPVPDNDGDFEDDWGDDETEWTPDKSPDLPLPLYRVDPITGEKTAFDERQLWGGDDAVYGYALVRTDGTVLYGPDPDIFRIWEADADGMVCFISYDDLCGHMDLNGTVLAAPRYRIDAGGAVPRYSFFNGYAVLEDLGEHFPATGRWVILDAAGHEVFSQPAGQADAFRLCGHALEHGLVWYETEAGYGFMALTAQGVRDVSGAVYESSLGCGAYERGEGIGFSEGLHPVRQNGLWGYIDEQAAWVIPPQYDSADNFRDGLALAEKDGRLMYIDRSGAVVWEEH